MSRVEQMGQTIADLTASELKDFREWFLQYESECWDLQIESDAGNAKLLGLAERALLDHEAGHTTEM